jgi:hypothetical protein
MIPKPPIWLVLAPLALTGCEQMNGEPSLKVLICLAVLVLWWGIERVRVQQRAAVEKLEEIFDLLDDHLNPDLGALE